MPYLQIAHSHCELCVVLSFIAKKPEKGGTVLKQINKVYGGNTMIYKKMGHSMVVLMFVMSQEGSE